MAEEEPSSTQTQALQVLGGQPYIDDCTMEDIIEKLKLLNYDKEFCQSSRHPFKLLHRTFFSQGSAADNANAQFYYFTSLVSWLMGLCGHKGFPPPGQFDDPNATSTNILTELRVMGLPVANLAPGRIRQGSGEAVLTILTLLADKALMTRGFNFRPVEYSMERYDELADPMADGAADVDSNDIDDNVAVDSDEEDDVFVSVGGVKGARDESSQPIQSQVSAEQWNLEVERVGPLLQVRSEEIRDWRARIEGAGTLLKAVEKMYPEVKMMLQRMGDDLEKNKDRIQKREQTLAQQFQEHVEEYRVKLRELNTAQETFNQANQNVSQLSFELNQVSEQLEQTKREIEDRENKISDSSPLMQIKEAVATVRSEIKQMSLRIGVLQHTVLHYTLRQSKVKREAGSHEYEDEAEFVL